MMRYLIPGILVAALATGMAIAQSQTPSRSPARDNSIPPATNQNPGLQAPPEVRPGEPARASNPGGVPAPLGSTTPEPTTLVAAIHSDDLLDATVRNDRNQSIGTVEALLISPDGKVAGVVLDVGGFLGVGARQVVVRMDQISMVGKDVRLNQGSKESLQTLPPYQRRGTTK